MGYKMAGRPIYGARAVMQLPAWRPDLAIVPASGLRFGRLVSARPKSCS